MKKNRDLSKFVEKMDEKSLRWKVGANEKAGTTEKRGTTEKTNCEIFFTRDKIDNYIKNLDDEYNKLGFCNTNAFFDKMDKDPNEYEEDKIYEILKKVKKIVKNANQILKEKEKEKEKKKKTIVVESEINNISDLLKLIESNPIEPDTEYNIQLESLHKIKEPLKQMDNMVGMNSLKENIVDQILYFVQDLHITGKNEGDFMHTVIYGPPGTGKTEIAKLMGEIYSKLGVLKSGTFKKVGRSDLIAGYLGQTAIKTNNVIKEALGGVLFIDEAYSLGNDEKRDSFAKECIDTLCEALSNHKQDLMVIIAGYEKEMNECFFSYNQGLDSRFTWRFKTEEYKGGELYKIFIKKVADCGWTCRDIKMEWFNKNVDYFTFFGRDMEILLSKAKISHGRRIFGKPMEEKMILSEIDLEKGFEIFLKNDEVKKRKENTMRKSSMSSLYV